MTDYALRADGSEEHGFVHGGKAMQSSLTHQRAWAKRNKIILNKDVHGKGIGIQRYTKEEGEGIQMALCRKCGGRTGRIVDGHYYCEHCGKQPYPIYLVKERKTMKNMTPRDIALSIRLATAEAELNRLLALKEANAVEMLPVEIAELTNRTVNEDILIMQTHIAKIKNGI